MRKNVVLPEGDRRHGTNGYTNLYCRCEVCKKAHREYVAKRRAERHAITVTRGLPAGVRHGPSTYGNWGCRCEICTTTHNNQSMHNQKLARERKKEAA